MFTELDQMIKLAVFKKDQTILLLESLLDYSARVNDFPTLSHNLVWKLIDQADVHSSLMDGRNLTRMLANLEKAIDLMPLPEDKRKIAKKTQRFVDRYFDFLTRQKDADY